MSSNSESPSRRNDRHGCYANSLIGISSEAGLCFTQANVVATGADQSGPVTASVALRTNLVDIVPASINWFVLPAGSTTLCPAGTSGPHKNYVTWTNPSTYAGNTATFKRIDKVCTVAQGATNEPAIGDNIGPQATSTSLLGGNSIFPPGTLTDAWQVLDGNAADCGTLSTLMKQELDLLGATDSAVKFVYARLGPDNNGWTGLVHDSPPNTN